MALAVENQVRLFGTGEAQGEFAPVFVLSVLGQFADYAVALHEAGVADIAAAAVHLEGDLVVSGAVKHAADVDAGRRQFRTQVVACEVRTFQGDGFRQVAVVVLGAYSHEGFRGYPGDVRQGLQRLVLFPLIAVEPEPGRHDLLFLKGSQAGGFELFVYIGMGGFVILWTAVFGGIIHHSLHFFDVGQMPERVFKVHSLDVFRIRLLDFFQNILSGRGRIRRKLLKPFSVKKGRGRSG